MTLQDVAEECHRIVNLRHDPSKIEARGVSHVNSVRPKIICENKIIYKSKSMYECGRTIFQEEVPFWNKHISTVEMCSTRVRTVKLKKNKMKIQEYCKRRRQAPQTWI